MRLGTQEMFGVEEVKGEATEASSSDREIPLWALFKAWDTHREREKTIRIKYFAIKDEQEEEVEGFSWVTRK